MSRVCVRTHGAELTVGVRSRSVEDLGRRWVQVELKVWRRTEPGLQVEEEESVVFSNIEVWVKPAGPSGLGDLEVTEYIARIRSGPFEREDGRICPPGNDRRKKCTFHMLTVFIRSNQIPLHVHAVFYHNNYYIIVFPLHVHCIRSI